MEELATLVKQQEMVAILIEHHVKVLTQILGESEEIQKVKAHNNGLWNAMDPVEAKLVQQLRNETHTKCISKARTLKKESVPKVVIPRSKSHTAPAPITISNDESQAGSLNLKSPNPTPSSEVLNTLPTTQAVMPTSVKNHNLKLGPIKRRRNCRYCCDFKSGGCGQTFPNVQALEGHKRSARLGTKKKQWWCAYSEDNQPCFLKFSSVCARNRHRKESGHGVTSNSKKRASSFTWICNLEAGGCGRTFTSMVTLTRHRNEGCQKGFVTQKLLVEQRLKRRRQRRQNCNTCCMEKHTVTKSRMQNHYIEVQGSPDVESKPIVDLTNSEFVETNIPFCDEIINPTDNSWEMGGSVPRFSTGNHQPQPRSKVGRKKSQSGPWLCKVSNGGCGRTLSSKANLIRHKNEWCHKRHGAPKLTLEEQLKRNRRFNGWIRRTCQACGAKRFGSREKFLNHMIEVHGSQKHAKLAASRTDGVLSSPAKSMQDHLGTVNSRLDHVATTSRVRNSRISSLSSVKQRPGCKRVGKEKTGDRWCCSMRTGGCGRTFEYQSNLINHKNMWCPLRKGAPALTLEEKLRRQRIYDTKWGRLTCHACGGKRFGSREKLLNHMNEVHGSAKDRNPDHPSLSPSAKAGKIFATKPHSDFGIANSIQEGHIRLDRRGTLIWNANFESVSCFCGQPYQGRPMIQCDICSVWNHMNCEGIDEKEIPQRFYCKKCVYVVQQMRIQKER